MIEVLENDFIYFSFSGIEFKDIITGKFDFNWFVILVGHLCTCCFAVFYPAKLSFIRYKLNFGKSFKNLVCA